MQKTFSSSIRRTGRLCPTEPPPPGQAGRRLRRDSTARGQVGVAVRCLAGRRGRIGDGREVSLHGVEDSFRSLPYDVVRDDFDSVQ